MRICLLLCFTLIALASAHSNFPINYFSSVFPFHTYEEGLKIAKETGKPIVAINQQKTNSCKRLAEDISKNQELLSIVNNFVFVTWQYNEIPPKPFNSSIVIPIIYMVSSDGYPFEDIINESSRFNHVYVHSDDLLESMKELLKRQDNINEFKKSPMYQASL
ncbi:hypothetical protein WA158_003815 [Blastocystis sp. Blastoise]